MKVYMVRRKDNSHWHTKDGKFTKDHNEGTIYTTDKPRHLLSTVLGRVRLRFKAEGKPVPDLGLWSFDLKNPQEIMLAEGEV